MKATFYTIVALIAFSVNSLFCRMALAEGYIDAWSFTTLRLLSTAMSLAVVMSVHTYWLHQQKSYQQMPRQKNLHLNTATMAMPLLKNTQAAVVQLCTPILAAILGMVFLSEQLTLNFMIASIVILGAVLVFILNKKTV